MAPPTSSFERPAAAIRRYKWLFTGIVLVASAAGAVATRYVKPDYEVNATLWIASQTPQEAGGPIRSRELLNPTAWVDLLRSYRIVDAVVRQLALYVKPNKDDDAALLQGLTVTERFFPGDYTLKIDKKTRHWRLTLADSPQSDSGAAGDSIGRPMGLAWAPAAKAIAKVPDRDVKFTVEQPRETSGELNKRLLAVLPPKSNFLNLTLTGTDPKLSARTLNALSNEYVKVAGELKRKNVSEFAKILESQLQFAEASLKDAETSLETFRVHNITLPAEGGPVAAGTEEARLPVMKAFFDKKIEYDNVKHDREQLERDLAGAAAGTLPLETMLTVPSVAGSIGGEQLKLSFSQVYKLQADINTQRQVFKDEYGPLKDMIGQVETLKTKTIPMQANELLKQLKDREADFDKRIGTASEDLQSIPARTIEEMRLRRAVAVDEGLYQNLKSRYAEAQLSEAGAAPDVNILDSAVTPKKPSKNTGPRILAVAVLGGLALAIGVVILLDGVDGRIRYPDQASKDLGLSITATVPELPKGGQQTPEQISQLVESFRTMRMNVMHAGGGGGISMAVSSPSPGDGKSFISSNLAMSFADAGFRTLLVDGDTRRGALHEMFGLPRSAGLTDFLSGEVDQQSIIHATGHDNLFLVPTGNLRQRSPELLTSPALGRLVADLKARYDVLIFDTPPLAAGIDGYAIAAATGSLLVVLRIGQTEKRMAAAKLLLVDRLPINVIGSVLNAAPTKGEYEYYGYVSGYGTEGLEPGRQVAQIS
ncbi:MAG: polysaccharide biosynthesis tyrosine autokinase [bacterium]